MSNWLQLPKDTTKSIYWRRLDENDCEIAGPFLKRFLIEKGVVLRAMKCTESETAHITEYAKELIRNGHSLCAYHQDSKEILGMTILSGPQKVRDIIPLEFGRELTKKQRQLERAFAQLAQGIPDEFADDLCMKCEIMVTEPSHANLGIASALVERSLELAKQEGCKRVFADCTSCFSARVCEKLGAVCLRQIRYADYVDPPTGERIFSNASPPHEAIKLMCHNL